MNLFSRAWPAIVAVAFSAAASAQGHEPECLGEWQKSSARESCGILLEYITKSDGKCRIEAQCRSHERDLGATRLRTSEPQLVRATWYLTNVAKLVNCDGSLKVNSCAREGTGAVSTTASTDQCEAPWRASTAASTCLASFKPSDGGCQIESQCKNSKQYYIAWGSNWAVGEISKLVNCDGYLHLGSCPK